MRYLIIRDYYLLYILTLLAYRLPKDNSLLTALDLVNDLADWHNPLKINFPIPIFMSQYNIAHKLPEQSINCPS
jgi:hypothetical protein